MPKIVDHDARREEIAQALWRIIRRDGIPAVSVRTVAAEAGSSPGAVRYYFPDQAGLLSFAMELVSRRVTERVQALQPSGPPSTLAMRYLEEVLPLDDDRIAEFDIWLAFLAQAGADNEASTLLREHVVTVHEGLRGLCALVLEGLAEAGALRADLDLSLETDRLHALIDGLALHAATQHQRATPARVRAILQRHLDDLGAA
ncbi:TetR/AcrR family transcriptional regulator [Kribbella deserti]|uniref:TetR/AcrR family transcriptional regulator n=1 Tax=Kribbella deserti TaxID=1926257 RepID=A0ABV6QSS4_9ACTN